MVLEVLTQGNIYIYFKRPPCRGKYRIFLNLQLFCKKYTVPNHHHFRFKMFLPGTKEAKKQVSVQQRQQEAGTWDQSFTHTPAQHRALAESEYLLCREQRRTALVLSLRLYESKHRWKKVLKERAFCNDHILEILVQVYPVHFHLLVRTTRTNFHSRIPLLGHSSHPYHHTDSTCVEIRCMLKMRFQDN